MRLAVWIAVLLSLEVAAVPSQAATASPAFGIEDYFRLQRIVEVSLSSDGRHLAYVTESLDGGRRVHLQSTDTMGDARTLDELGDAHRIAWIPGTHRLAFLKPVERGLQLFAWDAATGAVEQVIRVPDTLLSYAFSDDGRLLAYATREAPEEAASLYERFRNDESGILVDPATTSSHDFLNPHWNALVRPSPPRLWVAEGGQPAIEVPVPGKPSGFPGSYHWSSDGRALSVTFVADDIPATQLGDQRTSLGLFDLHAGRFRTLARGSPPEGGRPGLAFLGGEWVPGEERLLVRRVTEADLWVSGSHPDWAVVDVQAGVDGATWRPGEFYPRGLRLTPLSATEILLENVSRGIASLFALTPGGVSRSPLVEGFEGSTSLFAFSADRSRLAFVHEGLAEPPELFVRDRGGSARQVTNLNAGIAARVRYRASEVRWPGRDGVELSGWLLVPAEAGEGGGRGPWPLVTHVHGGPAFPFPNAFAPYFDYWPYPLEVYAARGMAVFLPNYRGTHSYGRQVATPATGREPVEDIIAGVEHLVREGVADSTRLGISGHSHGALVGPLAMARAGNFKASSFAEGVANSVVMYELMSGDANREIHDPVVGASLYEAPERYLAESPDMHLEGLSTASLFEGGAYTAALYMLGLPKAAQRFGLPTEFVVYPRTAHNIEIPALRREAAVRNLDWFCFWLLDSEGSEAENADQLARWRRMRAAWQSSRN